MKILEFKKAFFYVLCFLSFQISFGQKVDSDRTIRKIETAITDFFIAKGEINTEHKLGIGAYEITDEKELGYKEVGIYIIRTEYRTDGTDYLLLKNGENFEILDFKDLENVLNKSTKLLHNKSDEELYEYMSKLLKWYNESYLFSKDRKIRFVTKKDN